MKRYRLYANVFLYFVFIVLSDIVAAKWMIPDSLGFTLPLGIAAPAGVLFIGPILTMRDSIHDALGWKGTIGIVLLASLFAWVVGSMGGGGLLQRIAVASTIAFLFSELTDTGVYQRYIRQPWLKRVLASNTVSSIVDSVLFIGIAFGWGLWTLIFGQVIAKNLVGALWALPFYKGKNGS